MIAQASLNDNIYQTLNDSCLNGTSSNNSSTRLSNEVSLAPNSRSTLCSSFFITFGALVALLTIIGNIFVIIAFYINKNLQKYSNYFILNMAIADLMIGFLILAYTSLVSIGRLNGIACTVWLVLDYVAGSASVLCIVVISLDRYFLVSRGLTYIAKQKPGSAIIVNCAVWGIAFLNYAPAILSWEFLAKKSEQQKNQSECTAWFRYNLIYLLLTSMVEFFLPLIMISFLNIAVYIDIKRRSQSIVRVERKKSIKLIARATEFMNAEKRNSEQKMVAVKAIQQRRISNGQLDPLCAEPLVHCDMIDKMVQEIVTESKPALLISQREQNKQKYKMNASFVQKIVSLHRKNKLTKDKKAAHFLFILVFTFFVCWAPYTVLTLIKPICKDCINEIVYEVSFWMLWLNSTLNPIIYPFLHVNFRSAFIDMFRRIFCKCNARY